MLYTHLFGKTNKNAKEYNSVNATLLQKGGYIQQTMTGVYTYLHLGLRVLRNIEEIIRQEMDTVANEVLMPSLSPRQIWEKTGRIETIDVIFQATGGNELSRAKNDTTYILNSTHEEVLMPLAAHFNQSYKDFPFAVYQIQTKFRNEPRAKSGLLRGREFRMKDAYSFHTSSENLSQYYEHMKDVYMKIFSRLGIGEDTYIVQASGGAFTTEYSHEFQTQCEAGEDTIFRVPSTGECFNKEVAPSQAPPIKQKEKKKLPLKEVHAPGIIGVDDLAKHLNIPIEQTTKTILYETNTSIIVAAAVRGGYDINEEKLMKVGGYSSLRLASAETVRTITGADVGYAGILNLPKEVEIYMDESIAGRVNFECGVNKTGYHSINVNFDRDIPTPKQFYDIKTALPGDRHPDTNEEYEVFSGSEVGNIFPLGTKYTDDFDYTFINAQGKKEKIIMGCYGIGPSRVMGIIAEKYHDDKGLIWPENIAPYQVHLIGLDLKNADISKELMQLYHKLQDNGISVFCDNRTDASAGQKFNEADLIGIPHRLVISKRTGDKIEYKKRSEEKTELLSKEEVLNKIAYSS